MNLQEKQAFNKMRSLLQESTNELKFGNPRVIATDKYRYDNDLIHECESAIAEADAAGAMSEQACFDVAEKYAKKLCTSMAQKFYPEVTQFEPFDDLFGLLTQIDNMTTGLVRHQAAEPVQSAFALLDKCEGKPDGTCDKCGGSCMWFGRPSAS